MSDAAPIDRLRLLAARLNKPKDPLAVWFVTCLAEYEAGAPHGLSLGDAFGFRLNAGETPWYEREARARRDALLCKLAGRFCPGMSRRSAAKYITRKVRSYELSAWRRDKAYTAPPDGASDITRALFELLKVGAPVTESVVERALRHETPRFHAAVSRR